MFPRLDAGLQALRSGFGDRRALVVGDLMLDRYLWGDVSRISPEAPVPVVRLARESEAPGGAANVAANLRGLGMQVVLGGVIATDPPGDRLMGILQGLAVDVRGVVRGAGATTTKTRIIGGHQQILRLDVEDATHSGARSQEELISSVTNQLGGDIDVVVLSDYAKGVVGPRLAGTLLAAAAKRELPVLVDPKGRDWAKYAGATAICPNVTELADATGAGAEGLEGLLRAGTELGKRLSVEFLAVTRGEHGITLLHRDERRDFPATAREVFDVAGAGDTVVAVLAAGLAVGMSWEVLLPLANLAAGVVVGKVGTSPITHAELMKELEAEHRSEQTDKVCSLAALQARVKEWRDRRERVVFTNGCFDLLHAGHVTFLDAARRLGDRLIVALNTDRSVHELKGASRPLIKEQDRARVLAALSAVDAVVLFDDPTPLQLINAVRPDVLVKGQDYTEDRVVGATELKAWGGRVVLLPLLDGRSTTDIVSRLER